jgi:hypothetical protein
MLRGMGIETGVDLAAVTAATHDLAAQVGITPAGKYAQVTRRSR